MADSNPTGKKSNVALYVLLLVVVVAIVYLVYSYSGKGYSASTSALTSAATSAATTLTITYPSTSVNATTSTISAPNQASCTSPTNATTCENASYHNDTLGVTVGQYGGSNWQSPSIEFFLNSSANATAPKFNASDEYTITGIMYSGTLVSVALPTPHLPTGQKVTGYVWAQYRLFDTSPVQQVRLGTASYTT